MSRIDLGAVWGRAKRTKEWLDEGTRRLTGDGWLPLSVREHFGRDVPALIREVQYADEVIGELTAANADQAERLAKAESERDLAILHDRQPYPTQDAYDAVCRALKNHRQRGNALAALISEWRSALTDRGDDNQSVWRLMQAEKALREVKIDKEESRDDT